MIKKEKGDNVTWQKREIKEEKIKKKNGSSETYRTLFLTRDIVRKFLRTRF
jgi:hypothetical protein